MRPDDWPDVRRIHAAGIERGDATFETEPPPWEGWDADHRTDLRLVAIGADGVVGWAAASSVSDRCCYAGVVEDSVYVDPRCQGRGIGRRLLVHLVADADALGIWTVQASVLPENTASLRLHEACGFRLVGRRERLGRLNGVWRDVLLLERRAR
ncbi:MAG: GNAT family N-acetyltransferase [Candidatus Dormibacteria bacterium]